MIPKHMQFKKFKDPSVKKPIKRLEHNKKKNNNYAQKLANSLKKRALGSVKKSPPKFTKRKLNFLSGNNQRTPDLPKPMFYGKNKKLQRPLFNTTIEEGEIIEEIESSDDDCIVVEPSVHRIEIQDEDDDVEHGIDESSNDDVPTSSNFIIDKKRDHQLAWQKRTRYAEKGFYYVKNSAVVIDSITIDDSLDQSPRAESPFKIIDDRKPIAAEKKPSLCDESVIFVSEDFIPLPADDEEPKSSRVKESKPEATPKRIRQRMNDSLFTTTERKTLAAYNSNTYNPGTTEDQASITHKRPIIIDGSNVAFGHGCSNTFSAEGIKYCVEYFEKMGHDVKAVIPLYRRNPNKSSNPALLDQLYKDKKLVFTPCKNLPNQQSISYDDRFILQIAYERNAAVVSNDNYRDLIHENPAFKKIIENRVIGYSWCDNILILPKDPYGRFGPPLSEILRC